MCYPLSTHSMNSMHSMHFMHSIWSVFGLWMCCGVGDLPHCLDRHPGEEGLWGGWRWVGSRTTADRRRVSRKGDGAEQISRTFYEDVRNIFLELSFYFVLLWVAIVQCDGWNHRQHIYSYFQSSMYVFDPGVAAWLFQMAKLLRWWLQRRLLRGQLQTCLPVGTPWNTA